MTINKSHNGHGLCSVYCCLLGLSIFLFSLFCGSCLILSHLVSSHRSNRFVLGFYFRHKIKTARWTNGLDPRLWSIYSIGILSIVVQKEDLTEASLSYTEILQKGLQISDHPPLSEWQITLSNPISPKAIQIFERRLGNMAWFAIRPRLSGLRPISPILLLYGALC